MKPWSDEWRSARLRLQLRDDSLFQGETVAVDVCAELPPSVASKAHSANHEELLQRWQAHCQSARVRIRVLEIASAHPHASSSSHVPETLFRQDTQLSLISMGQEEGGTTAEVKMRAKFDLKLRHEFWDHPVLLVVLVTPTRSAGVGLFETDKLAGLGSRARGLMDSPVLMEEWTNSLLSLTREETQPTPALIRRVEHQIIVTKPLQLEVESRDLTAQRVGVIARVWNTHPTLSLSVRDVHLHLEQSLRSRHRPSGNARGSESSHFRVVSGDKVPFPVVLLPQERYNFLYALEPVEAVVADEALESPDTPRLTGRNDIQKKKTKTATAPQHAVLTLSWQADTVFMGAISETRAIVWSPKALTGPFRPLGEETTAQKDIQTLMESLLAGQLVPGGNPSSDFKFERLLPESALQAEIAQLPASVAVGTTVTVCVAVANRSKRVEYDLTLVVPLQQELAVVGFEASHRLGLLRPGVRIRRSVHVAFLRLGQSMVGPVVLFDHLTRTCFVSGEWGVFVKNGSGRVFEAAS